MHALGRYLDALRRDPWRIATVVVLVVFLVVGFVVHSDYGVSADEPAMYKF